MRRTEGVAIGKYSGSLEVRLLTNENVRTFSLTAHSRHLIMTAQAEPLRSWLHELEILLKEYGPLMSGSIERPVNRAIKYGAAFAEVGVRLRDGTSKKLTPDS